jgi:hypothetical protein
MLALMRQRFQAGDSWAAIARALYDQGFRNRNGNRMEPGSVQKISSTHRPATATAITA